MYLVIPCGKIGIDRGRAFSELSLFSLVSLLPAQRFQVDAFAIAEFRPVADVAETSLCET